RSARIRRRSLSPCAKDSMRRVEWHEVGGIAGKSAVELARGVRLVGFEPTTRRLKGACSAPELQPRERHTDGSSTRIRQHSTQWAGAASVGRDARRNEAVL